MRQHVCEEMPDANTRAEKGTGATTVSRSSLKWVVHPLRLACSTTIAPARRNIGNFSDLASANLRDDPDHHTPVLRASHLRRIRRDRLLTAVGDHIHLVQWDVVLVVQIALDRLCSRQAQLPIHAIGANVVRMSLDFRSEERRVGKESLYRW